MTRRIRGLFVFGTRPEAIKLAPVIRELRRRPQTFTARICVTAQHRELLDQVLAVFRIRPHHDLNLMSEGQSLFDVTARTLDRLEPVLRRERPDVLLVQGDTTTALASALAAFYCRVPVAHVEAGLRTYDSTEPYPEELNRRLISPIATFNFAPTAAARSNLLAERIAPESVLVTGNTVIDALRTITKSVERRASGDERRTTHDARRMLLVTAHRRESFGEPLERICRALVEITRREPGIEVMYPVHPNPQVHEPVYRMLQGRDRIHLLPPLDYVPFIRLLKRSYLVLSDSGGIQEEAPALHKPVLVLRDKTERPEAVQAGTARLVGADFDRIVSNTRQLLHSPAAYRRMTRAPNPFGDGKASKRIADFLEFRYGKRRRLPPDWKR
jgi:UDP-N-acetylglucosamine 2-epimerase (non-hydrolysing)